MKSALAIVFDYRPSRRIAAAVSVACALAALAPWASGMPWPARATVSLVALVAGVAALRRFLHPPFRRIALRASGWVLVDAHGAEHPALLQSHAHRGVLLTLGFRHASRKRFHALLAPDNLDAETRRRLIVLLARAEVVQAA